MDSKYFESLYNQLSSIEEDAPWANQVMGQLHLHKMDVRFLKVFCLCFETWDFDTDEESTETCDDIIMRNIRMIWAEEDASQSIGSRLFEIRVKDVQYFYPVAFDLEGKIQQTVLQIERYENLVGCLRRCKSSSIIGMLGFLGDILQNLNDLLNYRAVKVFPFINQIDTLKVKLVFLCNLLENISTCKGSSTEFVSFVCVFANRAACLTCLYWAKKEVNEQVADEMNLLLLDRINPCARANNLQSSDSIFPGKIVPGLVDLFYKHQKPSLKDDLLIYLFTNLSDSHHQLQLYRTELRLLRMFLTFFKTWGGTDEQIRVRLSSLITSLQGIWGKKEEKGLLAARLHVILRGHIADWHPLAYELEGKIQLSKLAIGEWLVSLFRWSFRCKPSTINEIIKFLDSILDNLKDLVNYKAGKIVPFIKQIEVLEEKLVLMQNLLKLTANIIDSKELGEFNMFVQAFAYDAACLTFLYFVKEANDETETETSILLSDMLQKIKPSTHDVTRMYFGTLKAIYLQRSDSLIFGQAVSDFVDYFLEDLVIPLKADFHILRDEIIFILTFLNDPPNGNAEEFIFSQIDALFSDDVFGLLPFDDMKHDFSKKKVLLRDFMTKIEMVYAKIRQHHCTFPDSSFYNFPKISAPRFLDFLLQNIRNLQERMNSDRTCLPYAKYKIIRIEEELVSLSPLINQIQELQKEQQKKLKDTWLQVVDVVHLTEHVINSCLVFNHPIWYHVAYFSGVLDRIKVVKSTMLEKIKRCNTSNAISPTPHSAGFISTPAEHVWTSEIDKVVVGFEEEAGMITDKLTSGSGSLAIVSIVGMAGLGKTTLAKKVYDSDAVKNHFIKCAFGSVTQVHDKRRLLLNILSDVTTIDDKISKMDADDLAHQLKKCLSRRRYLIVLDDIWNISAWDEVKSSFPDHKNGSRVMFTARSHEVANKCQIECSQHLLRFLSDVESWDLLRKKVVHNGILPSNLSEIGQNIAKNCKGLPLSLL